MKAARALLRPLRLARRFTRDPVGATAVEFAMLGLPFFLLIICLGEMGFYYMTQMALDSGTLQGAEGLRADFSTGSTPNTPSGSTLKSTIASDFGGGVASSGLIVEVQPLANLGGGAVAISDGLANYGSAWTPLVLRAKYTFSTFMPGWASQLSVNSSVIVRRQGE